MNLTRLVANLPFVRAIPIAITYRRKFGRWPNLTSPTRYTEKMQVAKLAWRSPLMTRLADKVLVKDYVAEKLGAEWVTPTLYAGPALPPLAERNWPLPYVIKANDRSAATIFVHTEADLDWPAIETSVRSWFARPYTHGYQWAYTRIPPQVLVEPFIGEGTVAPLDYKFHVFDGRVGFIRVHTDRFTSRKATSYDRDWKRLPFGIKVPIDQGDFAPPASLDAMIAGVERLATGFPFVRVDLYEIDGRPRFGEFTFYPDSGYSRIFPVEYDLEIGKLWPPGHPPDR